MDTKEPAGAPELPGKGVKTVGPAGPYKPQLAAKDEYDGDEPDVLNEHLHDPGDPDGLVADERWRKWQAKHPMQWPTEEDYVPKKRRWPMVLVVLAIVIAAVAGAYWLGSHRGSAPTAKKTPASQQHQQSTNISVVAPTKHYDSTTYTLGLDYPETWTVSDTKDRLAVISPATKLSTLAGSKTGHIEVVIRNQQTSVPGFPGNGATANLDSDKLTYKQPTSIQRGQTYLSYLGYASPNGIDALYLTGDSGYQTGQQVPMSDVVKGNPLVSTVFMDCSSDCIVGMNKPMTLQASSWQKAPYKSQVINLLQSLALN